MIYSLFSNRLFYELINDLMTIMAFLFMSGYFFREYKIGRESKHIKKILISIIGALMGYLLLLNNSELSSTKTLVDLRYLSIVLVFYLVGLYPALITTLLIFILRIELYDLSTGGLVYFINSILMLMILLILDHKIKNNRQKLFWFLIVTSAMVLVTFVILLIQDKNSYKVILDFIILSSISSVMIYYLQDYIETSNEFYRKYKENSTKDFLTGLYNTRQYDI